MLVRNWLADLFPLNSSATPTQKRRLKRIRPARSRAAAESLETRALLSNASVTLQLVEMPGSSDGQIDNGEEFDVELHFADTVNGNAVFSGYADISFDPTHLRAVSITHDADYGAGTTGMIDNTVGLIDEVGGTDGLAPPPSTRVATIRFEAISDDDSVITTAAGSDLNSVISVHAVNNVNGLNRDLRDIASYGSLSINSPQPNDFTISAVEDAKPEGDSGNTPFIFNVTRTGDLSSGATVQFDVQGFVTRNFSDSAATADDIVGGFATNQLVQFGAGVGTAPVTVLVNGDTAIEGNESFAVTLHSQSEGTISDGFAASTILGDDQPPTVTQITPSATEIAAQLSHPFDLTTLNLYDVEAGTLGAADATLVLDAGGPGETNIPGSLVVDGALARFIPTGGPLAAGTYTLTLRSADDAFRAAAGLTLLDGNNDGTPGDDFVHTFTIAAPPAVAVSLPDFARGPGQAVDVPATGQGLPISVSETNGVQTIELSVQYDPTLLTITGATLGADAPAGSTVDVESADPGFTVLTFTAPAAMPAGSADLISLVASVPVDATYGAAHVVEITNLSINGTGADGGDKAVHSVVLLGDSNGNAGYDGLDVQRVARNVIDLDEGYVVHPLIDPVIIGGVISDGDLANRMLSGLDVQRIAQRVVNLNPDEIPLHSNVVNFDVNVTVPRDLTGVANRTVVVPVQISESLGVEAVDITLKYDQSKLSNPQISAGSIWAGLTNPTNLFSNTATPGEIILTVSNVETLAAGVGSIVDIEFTVAGDVVVDDTTEIDLVAVQVNAEDVNPAPVDGADAMDGLVTFVPPPVFSFDFAPTGTTDFITSLDTAPNDPIVLDVYVRNAPTNSLLSYRLDLDEESSSTEVLNLVTGYADVTTLGGVDLDITDATHDVIFGAAVGVPTTADYRLGTITLSAPATTGMYDLEFQATSGLNLNFLGQATPPDVFNNLTINVQNAVTPPDFALGDTVVTQAEGNTGDSPHTAFTFTVTRTGDTTERDTIPWTIAGSGANEADAADFETGLNGGDIIFEIGEATQEITINVIGDLIQEADEGFTITLGTAPRGGSVLDDSQSAVITNDDTAAITVTPTGGLITTEAGGTDTFTVVLDSAPTADVTITLSSSDETEGTVGPETLTFTPANWSTAQTVTITGVDDDVDDGDIGFTIITAAATSTDTYYDGLDADDVGVTNTDDDVAGITVMPTGGLITTEAGGTDTFTVVLDSEPTANVTVTVMSSDATEGTAGPGTLTFTPANWSTAQTVTVTGVDDDVDDGDVAYTITVGASSSDALYDAIDPDDVGVTNTDDDVAGITVNPTAGLVTTEVGGTDTFTVVLDTEPTADVTIDLSSSDLGEGTVAPASLTFTPTDWNTPQTVTVTGVDDNVDDGDIAYTIITAAAVSGDANYDGLNADDVDVTNTDDDTAGITVNPTAGLVTTEAGGTDTFTIVLDTEPTADVTIDLSSSDLGEGTVAPASLTFTPTDWNTPQTVTVTGVDDNVDDGDIAYTIITAAAASADDNYDELNADDVAVTNTDDDTAGISVNPTNGLTTTEAGGTAIFTVVLDSEPTADVTINLSSSNTDEGTIDKGTLTFTAANWSDPQTVTITGQDDDVDDGDIAYTIITAAAGSTDANYNNLNPVDVAVTNTDDDTAGITVSPTNGLTTTEAGGTATFTVVLDSEPTADVTINLSSSNTDEGTIDKGTLTFTAANWSDPQTVTITGQDDDVDDGDIAYTIITAAAASADDNYDELNADDVAVTNTDDDTAGISVNPTNGLTTTEAGGTAIFTVVLDSEPTADVTINLSSSNTDEGTIDKGTLTFTAANWSDPQTVTITGQDDDIDDGDIAYTIITAAAVSTDANYNDLNPADVAVTNTDDDTTIRLAIAPENAARSEGDAGFTPFTFTVTRTGDTSGSTSVFYRTFDTGPLSTIFRDDFGGSLPSGRVDFGPGETEKTITINVAGDTETEPDEAFNVVLSGPSAPAVIDVASARGEILDDDASKPEFVGEARLVLRELDAVPGIVVGESFDVDVLMKDAPNDQALLAAYATIGFNNSILQAQSVMHDPDYNLNPLQRIDNDGPVSGTAFGGGATASATPEEIDEFIIFTARFTAVSPGDLTLLTTGNPESTAEVLTFDPLLQGDYRSRTDYGTLDLSVQGAPDLVVNFDSDEISENGGVATGTVTRNTDNAGALVVSLSSSDAGEATVPISVTIPDGLSSTTFLVTAQDDSILDGTQTVTITASASSLDDATGEIDITDDEVPIPDVVAELSMTLRDLDGMPGISVGESFEIDVAFRDVVNDQPLFSGYADILFDETIFAVDGIVYDSNYGAGQGGTIDNVNGVVDEVGATSGSLGGPGGIAGLNIFTLQVTAIGPGMTTITSNAGEDAVSEITSFDIDNLPDDYRNRTDYGTLDITVLPAPDLDISVDLTEISENGGSTTGTVTRQGNLSQPVTVTLASSDETELAIPESVTINAGESTATFTVNAEDDAVLDGTQTVTLTATAPVLGSDTVDVDVTDDETTTVSIAFGGHAFEAGEQDGSFEVSLTTAADFDLMIPVSETGSAFAGTDYTDFGGTITIPAGQTSHTFTIDVIDDRVAEFPDILRLQLDDPGINGVSIDAGSDSAGIFILDNDVAGIQISPAAVIVDEDRSTSAFDVSLTSEPTGTVTLNVSVGDPSESSVDLVTLTFDDSDWNIPQTVTVTGEDDGDLDGNVASLITVSVQDQMNAPGLFRFARPAEVEVTTLDNETATGPAELNSVTFYNHDADAERDLSPEGNGQRSLIRHIEVVVDGLIAVPLGEVLDNTAVVQNPDTGDDVRLTVESSDQVNGQTIIVIGFLSGTDSSGSLADGNYEFRLDGTAIGVVADDNGTPSPTAAFDFHRLFGDSDGDRDVDGRDLGNYRRAIFANPVQPSVYASVFDYDDDAVLFRDIDDVMELRARYGETLRP